MTPLPTVALDLATALRAAIAQAENDHAASKRRADWHNNNVPGVGQTVDYLSPDRLPSWVEGARFALQQYEEGANR